MAHDTLKMYPMNTHQLPLIIFHLGLLAKSSLLKGLIFQCINPSSAKLKTLDFYFQENSFLYQLQDLPTQLLPGIKLITLDIVSLYTNIFHTSGLVVLVYFLLTHPISQFVITRIIFHSDIYRQINTTAMTMQMFPSYIINLSTR